MDSMIIEIAAKALKVDAQVASANCKRIDEIDGWYFWNPTRGGASVIVDSRYEKLSATSAVNFDKHLRAFMDGRRN